MLAVREATTTTKAHAENVSSKGMKNTPGYTLQRLTTHTHGGVHGRNAEKVDFWMETN